MGQRDGNPYRDYYQSQLEESWAFEDFVTDRLLREGIVLLGYKSKSGQLHGENRFGIEIKLDKKMVVKYPNVYIEIAEKSHPRNPAYVSSGIYRNDNSWLYLVGNYSQFFIFAKRELVAIHKQTLFAEKKTETSRGFAMPLEYAESIALKVFRDEDELDQVARRSFEEGIFEQFRDEERD